MGIVDGVVSVDKGFLHGIPYKKDLRNQCDVHRT